MIPDVKNITFFLNEECRGLKMSPQERKRHHSRWFSNHVNAIFRSRSGCSLNEIYRKFLKGYRGSKTGKSLYVPVSRVLGKSIHMTFTPFASDNSDFDDFALRRNHMLIGYLDDFDICMGTSRGNMHQISVMSRNRVLKIFEGMDKIPFRVHDFSALLQKVRCE